MRIDDNPPSKQMQEYIDAEGLDMLMCSLKNKELLEANLQTLKLKTEMIGIWRKLEKN